MVKKTYRLLILIMLIGTLTMRYIFCFSDKIEKQYLCAEGHVLEDLPHR